ncbi:extracellular solute-binding protein [Leptolyngbya sp. NK1-12]|uniref:Extracellular solute-binding protein n=1 Tax=Leptolyngbya sp. NK1-12 TaxID=2547451 RepID=A0AA96WFH9_9CYAN|nr:extracellular solute-binding protein [Leptolyngbya sp. NK1-12]
MSNRLFKRRTVLTAGLATGILAACTNGRQSSQGSASAPQAAAYQGQTLVAACFQGTMETIYKEILAPALKQQTGADLKLVPGLTSEQLARLRSSPNNPPFDLVLLDDGNNEIAVQEGLIQKFPENLSQNSANVVPEMIGKDGLAPMMFAWPIVIAYNPQRVKTPPTSWNNLWDANSDARVGLINIGAVIGMVYMVEQARLLGGSESNIDPAFEIISKNKNKLAAVASNLGSLAALYQQGEADIGPMFLSDVLRLKSKGVSIDWAVPESSLAGVRFGLNIVSKPVAPLELAAALVNASVSPEVQKSISSAPYFFGPAIKDVEITGEIAERLNVRSADELMAEIKILDWTQINPNKNAWIERFNKETKG